MARPEATEVGRVLAKIAVALPSDTADDLKRLLAHDLSVPAAGEQREARLGLVIDLIAQWYWGSSVPSRTTRLIAQRCRAIGPQLRRSFARIALG
jgi:hypothetical protein